jgi:hypothetical protein
MEFQQAQVLHCPLRTGTYQAIVFRGHLDFLLPHTLGFLPIQRRNDTLKALFNQPLLIRVLHLLGLFGSWKPEK